MRTFLYIFVCLALAIAPLRGALAVTVLAAQDSEQHCAGMANMIAPAVQQNNTQAGAGDDCCGHCPDDCADGPCNDSVNTGIDIAFPFSIQPDSHSSVHNTRLLYDVPTGIVTHPFRPPASL